MPDRDPAVVNQTLQTMVAPLEVLAGLLTVTLLVLNANIAMMSQYQQASDHMQQRRKAQKLYLLLEGMAAVQLAGAILNPHGGVRDWWVMPRCCT